MAGLYIHIPFCVHKCDYCDFVSYVCDESTKVDYVDKLIIEMEIAAAMYESRTINTVFIGGGTPSILNCGEIARILNNAFRLFKVSSSAEVTVECNPGTLDENKLVEYKNSGVNRLSIGLQSSCDRLLKSISRIHTKADFLSSLRLAKKVGFMNINADIMYGLPTQSMDDLKETLDFVCDIGLTHISAYSLIMEENTALYNKIKRGEVDMPNEDVEYEMHRTVIDTLKKNGYERYEISNYAKPTYECKHNLCYWDLSEYIGLGVNAHSAMNINNTWTRYNNHSSLSAYCSSIETGKLPIRHSEQIEGYDAMAEYVMLGLRKIKGFSLSDFNRKFGCDFMDIFGEKLKRVNHDLYVLDDMMSLTDKGLDLQNSVLCEIL